MPIKIWNIYDTAFYKLTLYAPKGTQKTPEKLKKLTSTLALASE